MAGAMPVPGAITRAAESAGGPLSILKSLVAPRILVFANSTVLGISRLTAQITALGSVCRFREWRIGRTGPLTRIDGHPGHLADPHSLIKPEAGRCRLQNDALRATFFAHLGHGVPHDGLAETTPLGTRQRRHGVDADDTGAAHSRSGGDRLVIHVPDEADKAVPYVMFVEDFREPGTRPVKAARADGAERIPRRQISHAPHVEDRKSTRLNS